MIPEGGDYYYTVLERKQSYYGFLKYWNTVIHRLKPDLFISFTRPHTPTCYNLYILCKFVYNIDVLFIDPVPFFNKSYHIIGTSSDEYFMPFIKYYHSNESIDVKSDVKQYLSELQNVDEFSWEHNDADRLREKYTTKKILKSYLRIVFLFVTGRLFKKKLSGYKKNKKPYYLSSSRMNELDYFVFKEKLRYNNYKLKGIYKKFCVEPVYSKNYLYFAASYQPEATTFTTGVYQDFFLVLDIISSVIPSDWVIYFKEHPGTFIDGSSRYSSLVRDKYYYQRIQSYDNIKMVSADVRTFDLIDNAQAVATVSGTVAWEASVRGKPALSFGSAWYVGCDSIFWIKTLQDAKDAIEKILAGFKPDAKDIERYAAAIEKVAVKGMIHNNFDENIKKCENPVYEMERIAKAQYEAYERN